MGENERRLLELVGAGEQDTLPLDINALVCEAWVNALLALEISGLGEAE